MSSHDAQKLIVHRSLNVEGESCPYPEYYTLNALRTMQQGQVLEVIADCPQSFINIPESAVKAGHRVLRQIQEGTSMRFYIEVGEQE